jgi:hypothetical protein
MLAGEVGMKPFAYGIKVGGKSEVEAMEPL